LSQTVIADRYELICEIGAGAAGVVYKVLDRNLKKICALKTIKHKPDARQLLRFQTEAKAISALRHGNVVEILDFGLDSDNKPFLVMERAQQAGFSASGENEAAPGSGSRGDRHHRR